MDTSLDRGTGGGRQGPIAVNPLPQRASETPAGHEALFGRAQHGDERAWDALVELHAQLVWDVCRASGLTSAESAATCELIWLRFAQSIAQLGGTRVDEWLGLLAAQECTAAHQRMGRTSRPLSLRRERRRTVRLP
jgi:DNA-directed RNA polymerase specialized sigma24 family protein